MMNTTSSWCNSSCEHGMFGDSCAHKQECHGATRDLVINAFPPMIFRKESPLYDQYKDLTFFVTKVKPDGLGENFQMICIEDRSIAIEEYINVSELKTKYGSD